MKRRLTIGPPDEKEHKFLLICIVYIDRKAPPAITGGAFYMIHA